MTPDKMDELLPCPFCGGAAYLQLYTDALEPPNKSWRVKCSGCLAGAGVLEEEPEDARTMWNRRASSPARSAEGMVTDEMVGTATSIIRQALVDAAYTFRSDTAKSSAMFTAETIVGMHVRAALEAVLPLSAQPGTEAEAGEPVAWYFEWKPSTNNNPWEPAVSLKDPRVNPVRDIRNVLPLAPASPAYRVQELEKELERLRSDREFVVGFNEGWHAAIEQNFQFPTMLRKMWSGSEVQGWINKQFQSALEARATLTAKEA